MTEYTTPDDYSALDHPEDFLWVRRPDLLGEFVHRLPESRSGSLNAIPGDRVRELYYGGAAPEGPTEEMLVENREWLKIYVEYCLGESPIEIPEAGPLPECDADWLWAARETDKPLPEEEAEALRRLNDPARARKNTDGERRKVGPNWLLK